MTLTRFYICPDCAQYAANREDSEAPADWAGFGELREFIGGFIPEPGVDGRDFDTRPCDGCDSRLAGERILAYHPHH